MMLITYFKLSMRNLLRNKAYSIHNVAGLSIGIASAALLFLWIGNELVFDNVNVKKDRLYAAKINMQIDGDVYTVGSTPRPLAAALKAEIPGVSNACRVSDKNVKALLRVNGKLIYSTGKYADPSIFSMFTLPFIKGNPAGLTSQLYSIVLTETSAKKFFGTIQNIVGKVVQMDNQQNYVVAGVLKNMPLNSTLQFEWIAPYEALLADQQKKTGTTDQAWDSFGPLSYVELSKDANPSTVNKNIYQFLHQKDASISSTTFLFPMRDWHLYNDFANGTATGGGAIKQVRTLLLVACLILLIACINFMNLATARSQKRAKEVGVRKVLGSGRKQLIAQLLVEALTLSAIATCVAVLIMVLVLPAFNLMMRTDIRLELTNPVHIAALLFTMLIAGLLAGSYPAMYLSSFNPINALKAGKVNNDSSALVRKGLVIIQFGVSVVFIIGAMVMYLQVQHAKTRDLGFNKNNLVEIDLQRDAVKDFSFIKQRLMSTGMVENVSLADHTTLYGGNTDDGFTWQGRQANDKTSIAFRSVSPEYVSTSGMHVVSGRDFAASGADSLSVIVTASLAKMIDKDNAVGKTLRSPRGQKDGFYKDLKIVGVISDYVYGSLYGRSGPTLFFCNTAVAASANLLYVRLKPKTGSLNTMGKIGAVIQTIDREHPFQYKFVDEQFDAMFMNELLMGKIASVFTVLAITLSCLGLFSLATFMAEKRRKEIGIRKVLGAKVTSLVVLLSRDFIYLIVISCLVAFPVAYLIMHNWLQNYEYRVTMQWWVFATAGLAALAIALATISLQAIKAAIANPVKSLRSE